MKRRLPLFILGAIALLYVALLATAPTPVDWAEDYRGDSGNPLGTDVLAALLPEWLAPPGGAPVGVRLVDEPPFEVLGRPRGDSTYLFVAHAFEPDAAEAGRLLAHARGGATVFVAASYVAGPLADSLGVREAPGELQKQDSPGDAGLNVDWEPMEAGSDSVLYLAAPGLARPAGYRFPLAVGTPVLDGLDSTRTTVLATRADGRAVVARVPVGRGAFIVASTPDAFSNAALVGTGEDGPTDGPAWVAGVLAYVPPRPVLWDEYYKPRDDQSRSPLRYVMRRPPLRWAFGFLLFGVAAYGLFRGRRWQRPVPVVAPPPNASVEFVRTLGRLYFQHGDHAALAERKARYFTDRLRTRLGFADASLSEATEERAVRRGIPAEVAADAFGRLRALQGRPAADPEALVALDRALDRFFEAAG